MVIMLVSFSKGILSWLTKETQVCVVLDMGSYLYIYVCINMYIYKKRGFTGKND